MSGHGASRRYDVVAETRRRWSIEEKRAIVSEALPPGTNVSEVAHRHGVSPSLVFRWMKKLGAVSPTSTSRAPTFVPVMLPASTTTDASVACEPAPPTRNASTVVEARIEIELVNGRRVRIAGDVDCAVLRRLINLLET